VQTVTTTDRQPYRYQQLVDELRDKITSGALPPGAPLPSEAELGKVFDLSRTSVRSAIRVLREMGLVRSAKGSGSFVREPRRPVVRRVPERYQWEKDRVGLPEYERRADGASERDTGLTFERFVFQAHFDSIEAPADLARIFGVPDGTTLLRRRYRTADRDVESPLGIGASYLVHDVVSANPDLLDATKEPWPGGTQHQLSTIGVELDRIVDELTTRPPTPEEAEVLGIDTQGTSVFMLRKISIDTNDNVVEVADVVMPGDTTKLIYTAKLDRWSS
jgi:GntR family transcriptional regulator